MGGFVSRIRSSPQLSRWTTRLPPAELDRVTNQHLAERGRINNSTLCEFNVRREAGWFLNQNVKHGSQRRENFRSEGREEKECQARQIGRP